jgi:hypothetical protein
VGHRCKPMTLYNLQAHRLLSYMLPAAAAAAAAAAVCRHMPQPNQLHVRREEVHVTGQDLLSLKGVSATITEKVSSMLISCTYSFNDGAARCVYGLQVTATKPAYHTFA